MDLNELKCVTQPIQISDPTRSDIVDQLSDPMDILRHPDI
jgi:hypothetical protein